VALGTLGALAAAGVAQVPDEAIRSGFGSVRWPGRLEVIAHGELTVIVDGAHNPDGVTVLASTLEELAPEMPAGRATLLLGVMRDKEVDEMLDALMRPPVLRAARCVATSVPETERALPAAELAARWSPRAGSPVAALDDADEALDRALELAREEGGPLVIAGSLYLVGRLRARLVPGTPVDDDA
jgi:dihydrofolate synthase/folylpolyglutamate synthase